MSRVWIFKREPDDDPDPEPVPFWLDDQEAMAPCPCGREPDPTCFVINGEAELQRWVHPECLRLLRFEIDDPEEQDEWDDWVDKYEQDDDDDE